MGDEFTLSTCTSCDAQIILGRTGLGRTMPVNAEPAPGGTVKLEKRAGAPAPRPGRGGPPVVPPLARVVPAKLAFGRTDLRTPHWATCPYADAHRRKVARRGPGR